MHGARATATATAWCVLGSNTLRLLLSPILRPILRSIRLEDALLPLLRDELPRHVNGLEQGRCLQTLPGPKRVQVDDSHDQHVHGVPTLGAHVS